MQPSQERRYSSSAQKLATMSTLNDFKEVMDLIVTGKLKPVIDKTFLLKDAASAQERLWRNENFGKITLEIH